jgi:hypothetical protein
MRQQWKYKLLELLTGFGKMAASAACCHHILQVCDRRDKEVAIAPMLGVLVPFLLPNR